jgi:beta-glucosidase
VTKVTARVANGGGATASIDFRLGSPTGPLLATVAIPVTGGWQTWATATAAVSTVTGVHDLYVVFSGGSVEAAGNLNWFEFE